MKSASPASSLLSKMPEISPAIKLSNPFPAPSNILPIENSDCKRSRNRSSRSRCRTDETYFDRARRVSCRVVSRLRRVVEYKIVRVRVKAVQKEGQPAIK